MLAETVSRFSDSVKLGWNFTITCSIVFFMCKHPITLDLLDFEVLDWSVVWLCVCLNWWNHVLLESAWFWLWVNEVWFTVLLFDWSSDWHNILYLPLELGLINSFSMSWSNWASLNDLYISLNFLAYLLLVYKISQVKLIE